MNQDYNAVDPVVLKDFSADCDCYFKKDKKLYDIFEKFKKTNLKDLEFLVVYFYNVLLKAYLDEVFEIDKIDECLLINNIKNISKNLDDNITVKLKRKKQKQWVIKKKFFSHSHLQKSKKANDLNEYLFLVGYLPASISSSHTYLAFQHIKSLLAINAENKVTLFITNEKNVKLCEHKNFRFPRNAKLLTKDDLKGFLSDDEFKRVTVVNANDLTGCQSSFTDKLKASIDYISSKSFTACFLIGGGGAAKYLPSYITDKKIYLPFNINNRIYTEVDVVISHWREVGDIDGHKAKFVPIVASPQPRTNLENTHVIDNEQCKVINVCSALSRNEIREHLTNFKKNHPHDFYNFTVKLLEVNWFIIGKSTESDLRSISSEIDLLLDKKQIICIPFQKDLRAYLAYFDIYIQPLGFTGGGNSSLMAAAEGVPVLTLWDTDPAAYLTSVDHPRSPKGYIEKFDCLIKYSVEREYLAEKGLKSIKESSHKEIGNKMVAAIKDD